MSNLATPFQHIKNMLRGKITVKFSKNKETDMNTPSVTRTKVNIKFVTGKRITQV
jgi:hypothetical protein